MLNQSLLKNLSDPTTQFNSGIKMIVSSYETQSTLLNNQIDKLQDIIKEKDSKIKQLEDLCNSFLKSKSEYENKISLLSTQLEKLNNKYSKTKETKTINGNYDNDDINNNNMIYNNISQKIDKNFKLDYDFLNMSNNSNKNNDNDNDNDNDSNNSNNNNNNYNYRKNTKSDMASKMKLSKVNSNMDKKMTDLFCNNLSNKKKYFDEFDNYLSNNKKKERNNSQKLLKSNNNIMHKHNNNNSKSISNLNIRNSEKQSFFTPDLSTIPNCNNSGNKINYYKNNEMIEINENNDGNDISDFNEGDYINNNINNENDNNNNNNNNSNNNFFNKCKSYMTQNEYSQIMEIVRLFNANKISRKVTYDNIIVLLKKENYQELISDFNQLFK